MAITGISRVMVSRLLGFQGGGSGLELLGPNAQLLSRRLGSRAEHQVAHPPRESQQEL
jgi:hypothetical protein